MDLRRLKSAEAFFLKKYPGGFANPEIQTISKKHKIKKLEAFARTSFAKGQFEEPHVIVEKIFKLASQSTLISVFEKAKFRDMLRNLSSKDKEVLSQAVYALLHTKTKLSFENFVEELQMHKLAKWPLATFIQSYYSPRKEVFVKPTTVKLIITELKLDLIYKPTPNWKFYNQFRKLVKEAKTQVDKSLSPNNPAFCGFLMLSLAS